VSEPLMQASAVGGQLTVFRDKVVISRRGVVGFMTHGFHGDKEIRISQISSIQFKKAGLVNGFIQFAFTGGREAKRGMWEATQDENTIVFNVWQQDEFLKAKNLIEELMSQPAMQQAAAATVEDIPKKLEQLAQLREAGIVSEEEYRAKKAELLARM